MKLSTGDDLKKIKPQGGKAFRLNHDQLLALQKATCEVLEAIIDLCDEHKLAYVLSGGTALGAVRHQGFIPWDDDADFSMPRDNMEQLIGIIRTHKSLELDVLTPQDSHDYGLPFVQIRKKHTVAIKQEDYCPEAIGVCVDIFPIENMFTNPVLRWLHGIACLASGFILSCVRISEHFEQFMNISAHNRKLKAAFRRRARIGRLFSLSSLDAWSRRTDACYSRCKHADSPLVGIPSGRRHFFGELYKRSTFFPAVRTRFCGHDWCIPRKAEVYLDQLYGDWKREPAQSEREHHWYVEFDVKGSEK